MKERKIQMILMKGTVIFFLIVGFASVACAADVTLGLGAGFTPDYEGSEDYEFVPVPFAKVVWQQGQFVQLAPDPPRSLALKSNVLPSRMWTLGPLLRYRLQRDDVENNRVDRLKDVDEAAELGLLGGINYNNWNLKIEAAQDVADGHDGYLVTLMGGYSHPLNQQFVLGFDVSSTYASDDYMSAYFGIDAGDAARSGLNTFDADAGFKDVGLGLTANYNPWQNWGLMGILRYTRLIGDAADSPVVEDEGSENQLTGGVLVLYRF
jgi:outer membrane protein